MVFFFIIQWIVNDSRSETNQFNFGLYSLFLQKLAILIGWSDIVIVFLVYNY